MKSWLHIKLLTFSLLPYYLAYILCSSDQRILQIPYTNTQVWSAFFSYLHYLPKKQNEIPTTIEVSATVATCSHCHCCMQGGV